MEFFIFAACVMSAIALVRTARFGALERRIVMAERDTLANETALRATVRKFNEHMEELEALRGKLDDLAQQQMRGSAVAPLPTVSGPRTAVPAQHAAPAPAVHVASAAASADLEVSALRSTSTAPGAVAEALRLDAPVPAMVWLAPDAGDASRTGVSQREPESPLEPLTSLSVYSEPVGHSTALADAPPLIYVQGALAKASEPGFEAGIDWEQWLGVRGAAVLGGIVLALAALLFFKYSIEHSLISPSLRVVLGVVTGLGCIVGASRLPARYAPSVNAVTGGGVVVLYATFWAARALYGLVPPMVAFLLMALTTTAACVLAVRRNSLVIALLGVAGGFATPLLLASGKDNPLGLFGYVLLLDMGLMYMAYRRRWAVLMALSLAGTLFMQALWMGLKMGPERTALGLLILGVFAILFVVVGVRLGESDTGKDTAMWRWSLRAGLLSPFFFLLYFASNVDLGQHLYPTAIFALMLNAGACWVARRTSTSWLPLAAAGGALATVGGWALAHALTPALLWELVACAVVLPLPFVVLATALRGNGEGGRHATPAAVLALAGFFALLSLASWADPMASVWPWLLAWSLLSACACAVARGAATAERGALETAAWLPLGFAVGAVFAVLGWALGHSANAHLAWELLACACALSAPYVWQNERPAFAAPEGAGPLWEGFALVASCMGFLLLQGGMAIAGADPALWPAGLGVALMAFALYRAARSESTCIVQVPAAALASLFLGAHYLAHRYHSGALALATHLWLTAAIAAVLLSLAMLRHAPQVRKFANHAASAFAAISLVMVALIQQDLDGAGASVVLGATAALFVLGMFAATRLGEGRWILGLAGAAVFAQSMWTFAQGSLDASMAARAFWMQSALVCFVALWPFAARRAFARDGFAWMASALAGPLWFLSLRVLFVARFTSSAVGVLPVALGALSLLALTRVRTHGPQDAAKKRSAVVWQSAIALGFLSLAIPLQLANEWVTIGWAMEGFALVLLWRKLDHPGLKWWAFALQAAVVLRLVANSEVLAYHARRSMPILNWVLYTYWVPVAALVGAAALLQPVEAGRARAWESNAYRKGIPLVASFMAGGAVAVFFVWINLAIADYFGVARTLSLQFERLPSRDLATSVSWALYAALLLAIGMARSIRALRWVSLAFLILTIGKVFLYDLAELQDLYRVLSLLGLAISLIGVSLAYQRFVFSADKDPR